MSRQITVRDFAQLTRDLPPLLNAACVRGLRSAGLRGVGEVVRQIDNAEPYPGVDTGATRQSAICEPIPEGAELSVNTPQAAWLEFGTRPHMPPLGPILTWVTRKFGLGMGGRRAKKIRARKAGPKPPPMQGPKGPPKHGPKAPPKQGPRLSKFHKAQRRSMRHAVQQQADAENLRKALAIANKVRWKIARYGTAPRGYFAKSMVTIRTKYAPREIRHELKALEKRL
jgi:hypothetical protein